MIAKNTPWNMYENEAKYVNSSKYTMFSLVGTNGTCKSGY
jgi:hypothetical protein